MEKVDVESVLEEQLRQLQSREDAAGFDADKKPISHLIEPYKKNFFNPIVNVEEEHWVVFDEDEDDENVGYLIIYSESENAFGLATKTNINNAKKIGTFIGIYGSLADAIDSM